MWRTAFLVVVVAIAWWVSPRALPPSDCDPPPLLAQSAGAYYHELKTGLELGTPLRTCWPTHNHGNKEFAQWTK